MDLMFATFYFATAQICQLRVPKPKIQIHSVIHCINSVILISYLFYSFNINVFRTDVIRLLLSTSNFDSRLVFICTANSIGYFLADTIDILMDEANSKRRVYLLHHVLAIIGLLTVYLGNTYSLFAIWCLEIGGIVHHFKHFTECYSCPVKYQYLSIILYFIFYPLSRIYFIVNILYILNMPFSISNVACLSIGIILFIQNFIWFIQNTRKLFV
jgi:hypothetical protein